MSANPLDSLPPDADLIGIAEAVQTILKKIRESGRTYAQILADIKAAQPNEDQFELTEGALRAFSSRDRSVRFNRTNRTLGEVWAYIERERSSLAPEVRQNIASELNFLDRYSASSRYAAEVSTLNAFGHWLGSASVYNEKMRDKFHGEYVIIRKSMSQPDLLIKSDLSIERIASAPDALLVCHTHIDRRARARISKGILVQTPGIINIILNIEYGEGVETLMLRDPVQRHFGLLTGFLNSMNIDRVVFSARVILLRKTDIINKLSHRIKTCEITDAVIPNAKSTLDLLNTNLAATIRSDQVGI